MTELKKIDSRLPLQKAMHEVSVLNDAGIKVQGGKKYTQVVTRVEVLRNNLGVQYAIQTNISEFGSGIMARASIKDPGDREIASGHAYATNIAKEKSIEKLETTAIGRALAALGLSGGEYATQNEMDSHAERYEKPKEIPVEEKKAQRDFLYALSKCAMLDEVDDLIDDYGDLSDVLSDASSNHKLVISNGVALRPHQWGFVNVKEAIDFGILAKNNIENSPIESLDEWMQENDHKIKALDAMLKAKIYNQGGKPSERIFKLYDTRIENEKKV